MSDFTTFADPGNSRMAGVHGPMGRGKKVARALVLKYPGAFSTGTDPFNDNITRMLEDTALFDAMDSVDGKVAEVRAPSSFSSDAGNGGGFSDSGGGSDSGRGGDFID